MHLLRNTFRATSFVTASLVIAAVVASAHPALAASSASNDISSMFGNTSTLSFNAFLNFLEGPFAQIVAILVVIGAIWRLRQNFEWGEAGTTLALILVGVGMLALFPTIWSHFGGGALL